jgi:hypothetical protein
MTTDETLNALRPIMRGFETDPEGAVRALEPLYAEEVRFQDPLQTLDGRDAFIEMNRRLISRAKAIGFELIDAIAQGDQIFMTWRMLFQLKLGPRMHFDGVTHLRLRDGRVVYHRDYWDLLGGVADSLPIGGIYRSLVAKLG